MNDTKTTPPALNFCVIDFETGGFDPKVHALTQAAAAWFTLIPGKATPQNVEVWERTLNPAMGLSVTPQALAVQGRSAADVFSGDHYSDVLAFHEFNFEHARRGAAVLVAHKQDFDGGFLKAWATRANCADWVEKKGDDRRRSILCTHALCVFCRAVGILPPGGNDLDAALAEFGLKREGKAHDAGRDARLTADLFCRLHYAIYSHFGEAALATIGIQERGKEKFIPAGTVIRGGGVVAHDVPLVQNLAGASLPPHMTTVTVKQLETAKAATTSAVTPAVSDVPARHRAATGRIEYVIDGKRRIEKDGRTWGPIFGEWEAGKLYPEGAVVVYEEYAFGLDRKDENDPKARPLDMQNGWRLLQRVSPPLLPLSSQTRQGKGFHISGRDWGPFYGKYFPDVDYPDGAMVTYGEWFYGRVGGVTVGRLDRPDDCAGWKAILRNDIKFSTAWPPLKGGVMPRFGGLWGPYFGHWNGRVIYTQNATVLYSGRIWGLKDRAANHVARERNCTAPSEYTGWFDVCSATEYLGDYTNDRRPGDGRDFLVSFPATAPNRRGEMVPVLSGSVVTLRRRPQVFGAKDCPMVWVMFTSDWQYGGEETLPYVPDTPLVPAWLEATGWYDFLDTPLPLPYIPAE